MPYFIQPNLVQEKFNYVQYIEKMAVKSVEFQHFSSQLIKIQRYR